MFLWPSKPDLIYDPASIIKIWQDLGMLDHIRVQIKKNGCRSIVWIDDKVTLYDRHGKILTVGLEQDWEILKTIFPKGTLLDGELIGRKQGETSNRLYLWDMPIIQNEDITKVSYDERYRELQDVFNEFTSKNYAGFTTIESGWDSRTFAKISIGIAHTYDYTEWQNLLKILSEKNTGENEGLVFKDISHNLSWSRIKTKVIGEQKKFLFKYYKQ